MKKVLILTALFGTAISLVISSCKKDITLSPLGGVTVDAYFKSQKDITAALAGIYSSFQEEMTGDGNGKDEGYGGRYNYWGEVRSDNFDRGQYQTTSTIDMSLNSLTPSDIGTDWSGLYRTIFRANVAIKYIPEVMKYDNNVTQVITNNALAQAYALRAESYFYIVRNWGDAPLWTEPYSDINTSGVRARTPQAKLIDSLIIPDLQNAYALIQKGQTPVIWYVNEGAICAILADVYMWRAGLAGQAGTGIAGDGHTDYQNAITWNKNALAAKNQGGVAYGTTGGSLEPAATWKNIFISPTASNESIWTINWDNTVNGCACIPISFQLSNNPVQVDIRFQAAWKKAYKTDIRVAKTIDTLTTLGHINVVNKFYNITGSSLATGTTATVYNVYLPMYRVSDVYLSLAEGYAQTGDLANALIYLNRIHQRAGLPAILATQYTTQAAMEDAILQERQWELFGEGKRWYDLVRTHRVNQVMDPVLMARQVLNLNQPTGFGSDLGKVYWPISQAALNANNLLTQNASYK